MNIGPVPLIVSSVGRSGSTLLMSILGSNTKIFFPRYYPFERRYMSYFLHAARTMTDTYVATEEWNYQELFQTSLKKIGSIPFFDTDVLHNARVSKKDMARAFYSSLVATTMSKLHPEFFSSVYWCEKGTEQVDLLDYFENTERVVIALVRDPRNVVLSHIDFHGFQPGTPQFESYISEFKGWLKGVRALNPEDPRHMIVKYERMVSEKETVVAELSKFLGIDLNLNNSLAIPASHRTSRNDNASLDKWRTANPSTVRYLDDFFADDLDAFGYMRYTADLTSDYVPVSPIFPKEGQVSTSGTVTVGRDDWLFIHAGTNRWVDTATNRFHNAEELAAPWINIIPSRIQAASDVGARFVMLISPEKDTVYPDRSPMGEMISDDRVSQLLLNRYPELISYPCAELRAARGNKDTFRRFDSHWTAFGGYVVYANVMQHLDLPPVPLENVSFVNSSLPGDLLKHFGTFEEDDVETVDLSHVEVIHEFTPPDGHFSEMKLRFKNPRAKNPETVLVLGDSYSWNPDGGLARFLALSFETVVFIWTRKFSTEEISQVNAKYVIVEVAERFLIAAPDEN